MTSKELLTLLQDEGETLLGSFQQSIGTLSREQINWRLDMRYWSIAECLDHLNVVNKLYFPIVERAIFSCKDKPEFRDNDETYMHTLTGNMMIKMVKPENRKRTKAPRLFLPTSSVYEVSILSTFQAQHKVLLTYIEAAMGLNIALVKVYSPVNKIFKFNLGDALANIVHHDRRHFEQIFKTQEHPSFPLAPRR